MAGDVYCIQLVDPSTFNTIGDYFYLGKQRYTNEYRLSKFLYRGDSAPFERQIRLQNNEWYAEIWSKELMEKIKTEILKLGEPLTDLDREANEKTAFAFEWIEEGLKIHPDVP